MGNHRSGDIPAQALELHALIGLAGTGGAAHGIVVVRYKGRYWDFASRYRYPARSRARAEWGRCFTAPDGTTQLLKAKQTDTVIPMPV